MTFQKKFYAPEEPKLIDIMGGAARWEAKVHEHGLVALIDVMPRLVPEGRTADMAIVQAARVSYGQGTKKVHEDRGLIRYLMSHSHTTPLEMVELKFHCVMPIFIARQWIRHRTANVNEYSGRYSIVPDRFYVPETVRQQAKGNKQSSTGAVDEQTAADFLAYLDKACAQHAEYESLVARGVGKEIARIGLPLTLYTEWYWKCDLHNTLGFLSLRCDRHAQQEIQDYANPMLEMISAVAPMAIEAFNDYNMRRDAVILSKYELVALRTGDTSGLGKREYGEFLAKIAHHKLVPQVPLIERPSEPDQPIQ